MVLVIKNLLPMQEAEEMWVRFLGQEDPLEEGMQPTPVFLPGESQGQRRPGFNPWVGKMPWRREGQPTLVVLPGESHGQRSLVATVDGITKSQTRLSD